VTGAELRKAAVIATATDRPLCGMERTASLDNKGVLVHPTSE
jgi:hypothetical protein